jgi:hypothetical protein
LHFARGCSVVARDINFIYINGNLCYYCPVWGFEDGEFFLIGMGIEEKVSRKRFGDGVVFYPPLRGDSVPENFIKITFINVYLSTL